MADGPIQEEAGTSFVREYHLRCDWGIEWSWSIDGLQALVDEFKPQPEDENREYIKVLITAFEQGERVASCLYFIRRAFLEIEARSALKSDVPEHPSIGVRRFGSRGCE